MDSYSFYVYKASAGSGKTHTLVLNYLLLALDNTKVPLQQQFTRILAITFTNKAANEMKERILSTLDTLSLGDDSKGMRAELTQQLRISSEELSRRAALVRSSILHNYADFAVTTIDRFMQRVARTFAHDLNLSLNYSLELDTEYLGNAVVDELMALVGASGEESLTDVVSRFGQYKMADDRYYKIDSDLRSMAKQLFNEDTHKYLARMKNISIAKFIDIYRDFSARESHLEKSIVSRAEATMDMIGSAGLTVEDFNGKSKSIYSKFDKLRKKTWSVLEKLRDDVVKLENGASLCNTKIKPSNKAVLEGLRPQLIDNAKAIVNDGRALQEIGIVKKNIFVLALFSRMNELLNSYVDDNEQTFISKTNERIAELLRSEPAAFIYERIGSRYHHFLIDEFQDTSVLQWHNLYPLLVEGVSSGNRSMVVGDGKQAIYRFRKGDVRQFIDLPNVDHMMSQAFDDNSSDATIPNGMNALELPGCTRIETLPYNYRTCANIVTFNNRFFDWYVSTEKSDNKLLQDIFIGTRDGEGRPNLYQYHKAEGGVVTASFGKQEKILMLLRKTIETLHHQYGYPYGSMMVLADKKKVLTLVSDCLMNPLDGGEPIRVATAESLKLTSSRMVVLLLDMLRYVLNPNDRVVTLRFILGLEHIGVLPQESSLWLLENRSERLSSLLRQHGYDFDVTLLRSMSLYDTCESLVRLFHLDVSDRMFIASFFNLVADYGASHPQNLSEFIDFLDDKLDKVSTVMSGDEGAVNLMTVHKSKGLEAEVVFYVSLNSRKPNTNLWVNLEGSELGLPIVYVPSSKQLLDTSMAQSYTQECIEEEMDSTNKWYVALTRPRCQLHILCDSVKHDFAAPLYSFVNQLAYSSPEWEHEVLESDESSIEESEQQGGRRKEELPTLERFSCGVVQPWQEQASSDDQSVGEIIDKVSYEPSTDAVIIAPQAEKTFHQKTDDPIEHGLQIHALLAEVHHTADVQGAVARHAARYSLDCEASERCKTMVEQLVSDPSSARFFADECHVVTEATLVGTFGQRRPDRIVFAQNEVMIVDFKTGKPHSEHHSQVKHYCSMLEKLGYRAVSGWLIYLSDEHHTVVACQD